MKVLFLDVVGVLNDLEWIKANAPKPSFQATMVDLVQQIDPVRANRVNDIVAKTGCEIVLSSSTRVDPRMSVVLAKAGLKYPIHSATPVLLWRTNVDGSQYEAIERAEEVLDWLWQARDVEKFVILDDQDFGWSKFSFDGEPLSNSWVQTSFTGNGLTEEIKERIVSLLL